MATHPVTAELIKRGIPTFGSLDRQKARLARFNKESSKRWAAQYIRPEASVAVLLEQYRLALARGFDDDADAIHAEILYRLQQMRR